jgi:phenylpropionate dioxygenase-like ring-hydroxylating dioxygenase large terminal subunit
VQCIEDFCPHRGAPLSYGEIHGENIGCRYHGVVVDGTGTVQQVPAMPDCPMEGRKALRSYHVAEHSDAVFVFMSSDEATEPPPLPLSPELTDPDWAGFLCTAVWDVNYRYALDNLADPMHGCYLHAESFTLAFGSKQDLLELENRETGFAWPRWPGGENFDWVEFETPEGGMYCHLDIPYPPRPDRAATCGS